MNANWNSARLASHLNHVFPRRRRRAVQEAIIILVPLGEAEPLWQIWEILQVALKGYGVAVQAPCKEQKMLDDCLMGSDERLSMTLLP